MKSDHAFLCFKDRGASRRMRGKVLVELIYVSDKDSTWTQAEMDTFYTGCQDALSRLQAQAKTAGVPLQFHVLSSRYCYPGYLDANTLSSKSIPAARVIYQLEAGFASNQQYLQARKKAYGVDEVAMIFVLEERFRAFAHPSEDAEYCVLTQTDDSHAIAHEILHLFGATDLYYPYHIYGLTMSHFPETFMCTYEGMEVDDLTAYLIGWTDTLSPKAKKFTEKVSDYTVQRYGYANTLEFYRDRENYLLENANSIRSIANLVDSANNCDPFSEFLLGLCYRDGIYATQDLALAEEYFARSGRTGLVIGAYAHAQMILQRGVRTEKDREDLHLLLNYNSGAHLQLASLRIACLLTGAYGQTDRDWAMRNAIHQYQQSEDFLPYAKRAAWFYRIAEKAAGDLPQLLAVVQKMRSDYDRFLEDGDPDLQYVVAKILEDGEFAQQDLNGACTLYSYAAQNGNYLACLAMQRCHKHGIGTKMDLTAARQWLVRATLCRAQNPWDVFSKIMKDF